MAESFTSSDPAIPAVKGEQKAPTGDGVEGYSDAGFGVHGHSKSGRGVVARSEFDYAIRAHSENLTGLRASSTKGRGIEGESKIHEGVVGTSESGIGVHGQSKSGRGVTASSETDYAIRAHSEKQTGLRASSAEGRGIEGEGNTHEGVVGTSVSSIGVHGDSQTNEGVRGVGHGSRPGVVGVNTAGGGGVLGSSENGVGVWGVSVNYEGVHAETQSKTTAGLAAYQMDRESKSAALYAKHAGNLTAALFEGNVIVTGDITLANADCAEDFDISAGSSADPGTVMVLDDESNLRESFHPYDKRVAGVISGAGNYRPGLVLDRQPTRSNRKPIALLGKVLCKVDAQFGPIGVGDLLTTSPTPGHAMRVDDPVRGFGAVIGKALRPLPHGKGLIPIVVALQ